MLARIIGFAPECRLMDSDRKLIEAVFGSVELEL
jgi:hypothetical protein